MFKQFFDVVNFDSPGFNLISLKLKFSYDPEIHFSEIINTTAFRGFVNKLR